MTREQQVALWDVVNEYMTACGGRERTIGIARQNAVVLVEGVVDSLLAATRAEALEEAAALVLGQALEWDAPDQDDPGCERTVLLGARNAIRALVSK